MTVTPWFEINDLNIFSQAAWGWLLMPRIWEFGWEYEQLLPGSSRGCPKFLLSLLYTHYLASFCSLSPAARFHLSSAFAVLGFRGTGFLAGEVYDCADKIGGIIVRHRFALLLGGKCHVVSSSVLRSSSMRDTLCKQNRNVKTFFFSSGTVLIVCTQKSWEL